MKPAALTDEQLDYVEKCLRNQWPWFPNKHHLIASLAAMARERNEMLAKQQPAPQPSLHGF